MTSRKPAPAAQTSAPQELNPTVRAGVYWMPPVPENGALADDTGLAFTRFTTDGDYLTKSFSFVNGKLVKEAHATLRSATAETVTALGLREFAECLDSLSPTQAVAFGVMFGRSKARVVVESKRKRTKGAVARTRQFFQFAPSPGILMFDHDGTQDGKPIAPEELRDRLIAAVPVLEHTPMLWRPSASSGLIGPDGQPISGACGQRLYVAVADASLIGDAGKAIWDLLWAAGEGFAVVGSAGQKLMRSIIDPTVWQPERLDFAAAPIVSPPLTRQPTPWRILGEGSELCDLREVIRLADGSVQRRAKKARDAALREVEVESQEVRSRWLDVKAPALAKAREIPLEQARDILSRASSTRTLLGNFELVCEDGSRVTVADLLSDRDRWHGARFADPIEPDYRGDHRIAYADLKSGGPPFLWSHAHGGCRYKLARELRAILVCGGERPRIVDDCLEVLRSAGEVFELGRGGALVRVVAGRVLPVTSDWLLDHVQRSARFEKETIQKGVPVRYPVDLNAEIANAILAKAGERGLPVLAAVVTAPTLRQDGSLLMESGYDESSRLLLLREHPEVAVPILPDASQDQAVEALGELWSPFVLFPFVDDVDRGTYLAALLTACVRASLPAAPGFALDAPTPGTGKTLLARVLGALATGEAPPILSPVPSKNEEETRKRLFALVREGERIVIWDNVNEPVGNPALDSFLTAPTFTDRVLGVSEMASLPNRALFVVTGNNVRFMGDTCRRILKARLDAKMERPYALRFSFCPLQYTLANRQRMVADALTILRAYIHAGRPRPAGGSVASFEDWDDLVRQAVVWIGKVVRERTGLDVPGFADPMQSIDKSFDLDVETGKLVALLTAWHEVLGDKRVVVSELVAAVEDPVQRADAADLLDALDDIAGERGRLNRRILGRWLERNVDRAIGGFCLRRGPHRGGRVTWRVVRLGKDGAPAPGDGLDSDGSATQHALF